MEPGFLAKLWQMDPGSRSGGHGQASNQTLESDLCKGFPKAAAKGASRQVLFMTISHPFVHPNRGCDFPVMPLSPSKIDPGDVQRDVD